jgi:hypothetical protein
MEHVQDPYREPEGGEEDGAPDDRPTLTGTACQLQLGAAIGPALDLHR